MKWMKWKVDVANLRTALHPWISRGVRFYEKHLGINLRNRHRNIISDQCCDGQNSAWKSFHERLVFDRQWLTKISDGYTHQQEQHRIHCTIAVFENAMSRRVQAYFSSTLSPITFFWTAAMGQAISIVGLLFVRFRRSWLSHASLTFSDGRRISLSISVNQSNFHVKLSFTNLDLILLSLFSLATVASTDMTEKVDNTWHMKHDRKGE